MGSKAVKSEDWSFGEKREEFDFPVLNERQIRAAAGILFVFGFSGWMTAYLTGDFSLLRAFAAIFMVEMFLRLFVSHRFAPSMLLARFAVRNQTPEWVDAVPKKTAWSIGLGMVIVACFMMGWLGMQDAWALVLCAGCLTFMFSEAAFGFCVGCWLHLKFSKTPPRLCSGGVCSVANHAH